MVRPTMHHCAVDDSSREKRTGYLSTTLQVVSDDDDDDKWGYLTLPDLHTAGGQRPCHGMVR